MGSGFSALVTLSVARNALNGVIPPTWGQQAGMPALRFFNGSFNMFSGTLPQEWGSVPLKLNGLDVGNNTLTGAHSLCCDWVQSRRQGRSRAAWGGHWSVDWR